MKVIKNIIILICVIILTYFFGFIFGKIYMLFISAGRGGIFSIPSNVSQYIIGWPLTYIFLIFLLFTAFGGQNKYWWIGISLIPAALFEIYFDMAHIYFPLIIGLAGWAIGWLILKTYKAVVKR